ncbi:MAG: type II toxin-antitoxin system HicA family toxin [Armatimonadetes bacterium]|nr:type II toxin-antitoxin system HicA family toxin [Armatimonadota bacterium]
MRPHDLLQRLLAGEMHNVAFADLARLVEGFGFRRQRMRGRGSVYIHPACAERLCLQSVRGQAKPYQIRQLLLLVERHGLRLEA